MINYNPQQFHIRSPEDKLFSQARCIHAVLLRREGRTYTEIGKRLGITPARAQQVTARGERTKVIP